MATPIPGLLAGLLAIAIAMLDAAAAPAPAPARIAPDTYLLRGEFVPGRQPDGNTVILRAARGMVVVDTGRHAAHTQRILDFAKRQDAPIAAVVNTHWHLDHIGGNTRIRAAWPDAKVYGSNAIKGARAGFLARYRKDLAGMLAADPDAAQQAAFRAELAIIDAGAALHPDVVVDAAGERELAGKTLQVGLESRAVTEGDVWLYDAATGVLIAGDLVTLPVPFLDTACPARWRASLDGLAAVPFRTLVPGHGAPMTRGQYQAYRDAFARLLDCAAGKAAAPVCVAGWRKDAGPLLADSDPGQIDSMLDYYVTQVLRGDPARIAAACAEPAPATASHPRGGFGALALP